MFRKQFRDEIRCTQDFFFNFCRDSLQPKSLYSYDQNTTRPSWKENDTLPFCVILFCGIGIIAMAAVIAYFAYKGDIKIADNSESVDAMDDTNSTLT